MNGAKVLAWGGLVSAVIMSCGFSRIAGAVMLVANLAVIAPEAYARWARK